MSKPLPSNGDTRMCPVSTVIAIAVVCVALGVMAGWIFESRAVVQLSPGLAPMQATTAIGFLLFAAGLFFLSASPHWNRWGLERWFSGALLIWGLLNVLQHSFALDLGIDRILGEPFIADNSPAPGRMSLLTSLSFLIAGLALTLSALTSKNPKLEVTVVTLSCFLVGLSGASLFSYALDIPRVVWLGARLSEMAILTSTGFFLLSTGLIMQRFRCGRALYQEAFRFMWAPVFFGTAFAVATVYLGFHAQAEERQIETANFRAESIADLLDAHDAQLKLALSRMAGRVASLETQQRYQWENDAEHYITDFRSLDYLRIISPSTGYDWHYPSSQSMVYAKWLNAEMPKFEAGGTIIVSAIPVEVMEGKLCYWVFEAETLQPGLAKVLLIAVVNKELFIKDAVKDFELSPDTSIPFEVDVISLDLVEAFTTATGEAICELSPDLGLLVSVNKNVIVASRQVELLFLGGGLGAATVLALLVHLIYLARQRNKDLELAQTLLNRQKSRLEAYVENAPAAVAMFDRRMRYVAASECWIKENKLEGQKLIGRIHYDVTPGIREEWKAIHQRCLSGESASRERDHWRPPGWKHDQYLRWEIRPWTDNEGEIGGIMMFTADITNEVTREQELIEMREKAETANRSKTNFLANMSHEIRTPMNSILGFAELLSNEISDTRHAQFIRSIQSSGKTLLSLINDLLDLAKIDAGKIELAPKPVDLRKQFMELKDIFQLQADTKGIGLNFEVQDELPSSLVMDDFRLQQVLLNLLSNAIKFTSRGEVTTKLSYTLNHGAYDLTFAVSDTGCGIPESFRERAFSKFEQAGDAAQGGTGLGLAISSKLVRLMGGEVDYSSKLGEGTTFFFTLPNVAAAAPSVDPVDASETRYKRLLFPEAKILMVDDSQTNLELLRAVFSGFDSLEVFEANGGIPGIELAHKLKPDIILLDIAMPDKDGRDVCLELRKEPAFAETPIIAITASVQKSATDLLEFGFNECLIKPVPPHVLLRRCHYWLNGKPEPHTRSPFVAESKDNASIAETISPEFLDELQQGLKRHQRGMVMNDVRNFAGRITVIAQASAAGYLGELGAKLQSACESFDIAGVRQTLAALSTHLSTLNTSNDETH